MLSYDIRPANTVRNRKQNSIILNFRLHLSQPDFIGVRGNGLGLNRSTSEHMTKESATRWSLEINFMSTREGHSSGPNKRDWIETGDDLELDFYFVDHKGKETKMQGPPFKIPMPQSLVSQGKEAWPRHRFYPFFFETEGETWL